MGLGRGRGVGHGHPSSGGFGSGPGSGFGQASGAIVNGSMSTTSPGFGSGFGWPSRPATNGGMNTTSSSFGFGQRSKPSMNGGTSTNASGFGSGSNTQQQQPPPNGNTGNANRDITSFFSQMSTSTRPAASSNARQNRTPIPLPAKPTVNANEVTSFFSQMGTGSRPPAQKPGHSHGHGGTPNGFHPPTAPAAMRSNGFASGSTTYSPGSVQWRPNPNRTPYGLGAADAGNAPRAPGGFKVATSLPEGWYR